MVLFVTHCFEYHNNQQKLCIPNLIVAPDFCCSQGTAAVSQFYILHTIPCSVQSQFEILMMNLNSVVSDGFILQSYFSNAPNLLLGVLLTLLCNHLIEYDCQRYWASAMTQNNRACEQGNTWTLKRHFLRHDTCKVSQKISEREHGSSARPLANALRGISFLRCEVCSQLTNWLKQSKMRFFEVHLLNIRVFSLHYWKQCHAGIGEGLVAHLANFHDWQKITSNKNQTFRNPSLHLRLVFSMHSNGFSWKINQPIRMQLGD